MKFNPRRLLRGRIIRRVNHTRGNTSAHVTFTLGVGEIFARSLYIPRGGGGSFFYITLAPVEHATFPSAHRYRPRIAMHSTWMFLNRAAWETAGLPKEPRVPALSHCPVRGGNLYALCAGTKRTRQLRYLMSEELFLADYRRVRERRVRHTQRRSNVGFLLKREG